jgi:hypothetical protein
MIYNNVKVDIKTYYQPSEIDNLKLFVLDNLKFIQQQKLSSVNDKIKKIKHR